MGLHMAENNACIITVGNELLSGRTLNTNAQYISAKLNLMGISVVRHVTVGDNAGQIVSTLRTSLGKYRYIFITGGLGPTDDDRTLQSAARALDREIVQDRDMLAYMEKNLRGTYSNTRKLSMRIKGGILLQNNEGTAYGQCIHHGESFVYLLPGVHAEAVSIMDSIAEQLKQNDTVSQNTSIRVYAIKESELTHQLSLILENSVMGKIALLPSYGYVDIILYRDKFSASDGDLIKEKITRHLKGHIIPGDDLSDISMQAGHMLIKRGLFISCAESCTGGMLSKRITDIPGSSAYFMGSVTAYSNDCKIKLLNVSKSDIKQYGAVSVKVSEQMARGAAELFNTDIGVSVTGIAGPGGGTEEKPVGTVFSSISFNRTVKTEHMAFSGSRNSIRSMAAGYIIYNIIRTLNE